MQTRDELEKMKKFISRFFAKKSKPISVLFGPSGVGKTYWVKQIATEKGYQEYRMLTGKPPVGKSYGYISGLGGNFNQSLYIELHNKPDGLFVFEDNVFHKKPERDFLIQLASGNVEYKKRLPPEISKAFKFSGKILFMTHREPEKLHKEIKQVADIHQMDLVDQPYYGLDVVDLGLESFLNDYELRTGEALISLADARKMCSQHRKIYEYLIKAGADIIPGMDFNFFKFNLIAKNWLAAKTELEKTNQLAKLYQFKFKVPV